MIDGNYRAAVVEGPVWRRADTVVWLDLARRIVMRRIIGRTLRRVVRREELWNGNREPWRNLWAWDPNRSVIRWAWTQHDKYATRFAGSSDPALAHLSFVRLRSPAAGGRLRVGGRARRPVAPLYADLHAEHQCADRPGDA
ncbi:MAG: hypothetical protein R2695_00385 [Acidimicrobiales bacterium]